MKTMKKLASLIMALAMVLALAVSVSAEEKTGSITVNKAIDGKTYTAYRIFVIDSMNDDGTMYSYKINEGWEDFFKDGAKGAGFVEVSTLNPVYVNWVDGKTADQIAQFAKDALEYAKGKNMVGTDATKEGETVIFKDLPLGYYLIDSSVGALCSLNVNAPAATIEEKNSVPAVVKKAGDGKDKEEIIVEAGEDVPFTVTITVGKGAVNYKLHDKMTAGLKLNDDSIKVTGIEASQYTVQETPDDGDDLTISFVDGIDEGTEITVTYTAKVTSSDLSADPAKNGAWVTYGDDGDDPTPPSEVKVYNAKFTVTKVDGSDQALAGAGFVLQSSEGYYKRADDGKSISWVPSIAGATELKSTVDSNEMVFTGLAAGTYTLIENTVPDGYNKAADVSFTITDVVSAENLVQQSQKVVNQTGAELPETGGIGTTIFTAVGSVLMIGAAILYITKKRSEDCAN